MALQLPHIEDLATNAKLPGQLTADMKAIEAHDAEDHKDFDQEVKDRKDADGDLQDQINKTNDHLDKLDAEKATHDDVEELREELLKKIKHIILGTDEETVKAVIQEMKKEGTI